MQIKKPSPVMLNSLPHSRRKFVQGLVAGGVIAGIPGFASAAQVPFASKGTAPVLSGTEIDLTIAESLVNFTGQVRTATTINGSLPAPTLYFREGDEVTIRVSNQLAETTSIHWHGILLPYQMDGVPGLSFSGIAPGTTFTYRFKLQQSGTYWYHSHSGMQELTGMYGAIVVLPALADNIIAERDYVVQLSDWTDEDPMRVFGKLKAQSDYYNYNRPTMVDFLHDVTADGLRSAMNKRQMWNKMRMNPTDLADLSAATLTYLMNGTTPAGNWSALFSPGEKVRLRFINAASNTFFDVRIPGLKLTVVQADGVNVEPVSVDEFRFGPGETIDVVVSPADEPYTIFAQSMERSGYTRGTLSPRAGLQAAVPELDPVQWLRMADMMGAATMTEMDHSAMAMDHSGMAAMDQVAMAMNHDQHQMTANQTSGLNLPGTKVRHASSEYGPSTDMRVEMPRSNLDDPGVGLRNNGRRVLTLADLSTIGGPLDPRGAQRELELHLTGNMERYAWSFDGLEFGQSTPVHLRHGERVRIILQNDTMMTHPMHLHGMWSELEDSEGRFVARRHTIAVQPAQRISFLVNADAVGRWAWHCHLAFHMEAGMLREVVVA